MTRPRQTVSISASETAISSLPLKFAHGPPFRCFPNPLLYLLLAVHEAPVPQAAKNTHHGQSASLADGPCWPIGCQQMTFEGQFSLPFLIWIVRTLCFASDLQSLHLSFFSLVPSCLQQHVVRDATSSQKFPRYVAIQPLAC
jgi:hypothetical protein